MDMALIGLFGAIALVTVTTLWAGVKLCKWVLAAEDSDTAFQYLQATANIVKPYWVGVLVLVGLIELWPGVSSWATAAFNVVIQIW